MEDGAAKLSPTEGADFPTVVAEIHVLLGAMWGFTRDERWREEANRLTRLSARVHDGELLQAKVLGAALCRNLLAMKEPPAETTRQKEIWSSLERKTARLATVLVDELAVPQ